MIGQQGVTQGRKKKKLNYVDMINARTPYLVEKYANEENEAYNDEILALEKKKMAENKEYTDEQLKEQKKQGNVALGLGVANLGTQAYMGYKQSEALEKLNPFQTGKTGLGISDVTEGFKGAGTSWSPWAGGAAGAYLGHEYGDKVFNFGSKKDRKILGGALAGGASSYALSGGNPYSAVIGAIIGGSGGLF